MHLTDTITQPIDDEFSCIICFDENYTSELYLASCCSQILCENCLQCLNKTQCPHCRKPELINHLIQFGDAYPFLKTKLLSTRSRLTTWEKEENDRKRKFVEENLNKESVQNLEKLISKMRVDFEKSKIDLVQEKLKSEALEKHVDRLEKLVRELRKENKRIETDFRSYEVMVKDSLSMILNLDALSISKKFNEDNFDENGLPKRPKKGPNLEITGWTNETCTKKDQRLSNSLKTPSFSRISTEMSDADQIFNTGWSTPKPAGQLSRHRLAQRSHSVAVVPSFIKLIDYDAWDIPIESTMFSTKLDQPSNFMMNMDKYDKKLMSCKAKIKTKFIQKVFSNKRPRSILRRSFKSVCASPRFYFELKVLRLTSNKEISIGVCDQNFDLDGERMVGWNDGCGFHGDNGRIYCNSGEAMANIYASPFQAGDVVGCGYNRMTAKLFFTFNGILQHEISFSGNNFDNLVPAVTLCQGQEVHERSELEVVKPVQFRYKEVNRHISL